MTHNAPSSRDRSLAAILLLVGTFIWFANPFPFFGLGPLQLFLSDAYHLRTISQLRQAGMLHPFSSVFICVEIQALLLLALVVTAFVRRSEKLAFVYVGLIIILSILPWLRFFSELSVVH
jgi:hypothetical protein